MSVMTNVLLRAPLKFQAYHCVLVANLFPKIWTKKVIDVVTSRIVCYWLISNNSNCIASQFGALHRGFSYFTVMPMSTRTTPRPDVKGKAFSVHHDTKEEYFYITLPHSEKAVLQYTIENPGIINFYHTEVPESQRGNGLGKLLVKEGLTFAKESSFKIRPTCWYVAKYVKENCIGDNDITVIS